MKGTDRCLDEDEGRNSIARVGSETASLSNPIGHMWSYGWRRRVFWNVRPCSSLKFTDVSEELNASIFSFEEWNK
jgi:hypothetical protein